MIVISRTENKISVKAHFDECVFITHAVMR